MLLPTAPSSVCLNNIKQADKLPKIRGNVKAVDCFTGLTYYP